MGKGLYRAPGDHHDRPSEMIYVAMTGYNEDEYDVARDDIYDTIRRNVPKSFCVTDRKAYDGVTYEVFMENSRCEIVVQEEDGYIAVVFLAKEKIKGWYMDWKRTALRVFEKLHEEDLSLTYRTSAWTSSKWTPAQYQHCGKNFRGIDAHRG